MGKALNNMNLKILAYHAVFNQKIFERQLIYLKSRYNLINLSQLEDHLFLGKELPQKPVLITFDDGDKSLYENAFPILKEYNVPAVVFIITDLIDTNKPFWWDEIKYYLGMKKGNEKVWELKNWKNKNRVEYIEDLRSLSNKPALYYTQLTSIQLKEMHTNDIQIANHSHSHPMFDQCSEMELQEELVKSKEILKKLNLVSNVFAYPNGNFSSFTENQLVSYNIKLAFLFDHKINKEKINPLRISRLRIDDSTSLRKMKFILSGNHSKILPFIKFIAKSINYKG